MIQCYNSHSIFCASDLRNKCRKKILPIFFKYYTKKIEERRLYELNKLNKNETV